jgi:hypothetical protein
MDKKTKVMIDAGQEYQYEDGTVRSSWATLNESARHLVLDVAHRLGSEAISDMIREFFEHYV